MMELKKIEQRFAVCKIKDFSEVDFSDQFLFIGKTEEELSLVCAEDKVPKNTLKCDLGWKAFRIQGILEFSIVGVLSELSTLLAENKIGIFAVSTYNTDYILTKEENFERALKVLLSSGYQIK